MRYQVTFATAGSNSGNGRYRRPVHVRVVDSAVSYWHAVRGLNDGMKLEIRNVDSRYNGPRSAYGKALREAKELANRLNEEITASCVI